MSSSYNIDTSLNVNGGLTINGDTSIPSTYNLYVGGNITGNTNLYVTSTITGNTINAITANITNINSTGTISGGTLKGDGSNIVNLSTSAMPNAFLIDGSRQMTGTMSLNNNQLRIRASTDANHYIQYFLNSFDGTKTVDGPRIAGYQGVELVNSSASKSLASFLTSNSTINSPLTVSGNTTVNGTLTATSTISTTGTITGSAINGATANMTNIYATGAITGGSFIGNGTSLTVNSYGNIPSNYLTHSQYFPLPQYGDKLRWRLPLLVEYYSGGVWNTWSTSSFDVLTDGRGYTGATVDYAHSTLRLTYSADAYSSAQILYVGASYNAPTGNVTIESSNNQAFSANVNTRASNVPCLTSYWSYTNFNDLSSDTYIRLTFNWAVTSGNSFTMNNLVLYTARNDNQGASFDSWLPFSWDVYKNITMSYLNATGITANAFTESGTLLSNKYLGINATATNSTNFNGLNSGQFLRSDLSSNLSANINMMDSVERHISGNITNAGLFFNSGGFGFYDWKNSRFLMSYNQSANTLNFNATNFQISGNNVWTNGNDGSGSGLDADTVDGKHSSAFAPSGYGLGTVANRLTSGNDLNQVSGSGWYDVQNPTNGVVGMSWHNILQNQTADWNYVNQIAFPMTDNLTNHMYIRNKSAGSWGSWSKVWTDSNMGSGSGLNADTIDGIQGSQIVADTGIYITNQDLNTITGNGVYRVGNWSGNNIPTGAYAYGTLEVLQTNNSVTQNYYSHSSGQNTGMWTRTKWNASDWTVWKKIWTDNNMGAGSGLDADKVDGLNSSQFLRSDVTTYLNGDLNVTGNVIATLNISGNHTGTGSSLTVNGTTVNGGVNPISNGWAYTHENKIGSLGHIPSGGTSTTFLRGDNTWVIPTDTYVNGLSSTAGGNGTLTVSRNTGGNLTIDLSHNHDSSYLKLGGGNVTGNLNVTANLNADRYYQNANGTPTSNLGSPSVSEMALFQQQFTNKTWFFDPTKFTFEYTNDGVTWTNLAPSTNTIMDFVSGLNNTNIAIPNACQQFRITIQNDGNYVYLNALYMYFSTNSHQTQVTIDKFNSQSQTWSNHVNSTNKVSSWPGHLYLPFSTIPFSTSTSSSTYYSSIRIIFTPTWSNDPTYGTQPINLYGMEVWGGYPAGMRTIYTWDRYKNVTFPAQVTATSFIGSGNQLTVSGTPTSGSVNPINSGWAYTHANSYGLGYHVPTGGTSSTYLRGDGTWVTPTDTYVTGISSTSGGNGILTVSMNTGSNFTLDLTHNHNSSYLGISGTAVNSTLFNNLSSNQFVRSDSATTMSVGLLFNATASAGPTSSTPTALSYGQLQAYGTLNILADTDGSHTEYVYLSAGYPSGGANNGLAIGYNLANFTWKGYTIWHSGNMGAGSGLDADTIDGHNSTYFVYNGQNHIFNNMSGGASYDQVDLNTLQTIGEYRFLNLAGSGTANRPNDTGMGYYFGMGGGDVGNRGFQLLGTSNKNLWFREMSNQTWVKIWNDHNQGAGSGLDADTVDGINSTQFVRNDLANQSVNTGFTMSGNAYLGMSNGSGALYIRTGAGSVGIQLAGDNSTQQSGVGSYINANGTANFSGTMTANTIAVTSTALVNNLNAQMINSVKEPQLAKNQSIADIGGKGVYTGYGVTAQSVPNMTVQVGTGTTYTDSGMRVVLGSSYNVSFSAPSATYNRIDSVYVQGSSAGANEGVVTVAQGVASSSPVAPSIPSDGVLLANVTIRQNAGSILSTDITDMRVWKPLYTVGQNTYTTNTLYIQGALDSTVGGTITLNKPIQNTPSNNSITISAGSTSYTWTHNLNLSRYIVKLSWNNSEPHVTWSNKTANAITINLDNVYDTDTIVDIGIEAF